MGKRNQQVVPLVNGWAVRDSRVVKASVITPVKAKQMFIFFDTPFHTYL
ncbi:MAG: hypothetical protein WKG06_33320 [Segetibacter sp.]